jgi:hypothetical protein
MKHEKKICDSLPLGSFKEYSKEMLMNSSKNHDVIATGMSITERTLNFLIKSFRKLPEIELDGFFIHQVKLLKNQTLMFMSKYLSTEASGISKIQPFKRVEDKRKRKQ